jgi:probable HAF family extracellular repeat protein
MNAFQQRSSASVTLCCGIRSAVLVLAICGLHPLRPGPIAAQVTTSQALPSVSLSTSGAWQVAITDLQLLPGGFFSSARAINDTGKIVGTANDSTGALYTVEWVNGQVASIPGLGPAALSVPTDVNDSGEIAGYYALGGQRLGIYWDAQNNPFLLPALPGGTTAFTDVSAINNSGFIVGRSAQGPPNFFGHAVIWLGNTFQTDLGFAGSGTYSEALDINDSGVIVGVAGFSSTVTHAFRWQSGQYTDLGSWPGAGPYSKAYGINNAGTIVGLNSNVASVWKNGAVSALPMPPGISAFTPAIDINDAGDIIATGSKGYPIEVGVLWRNGQPIDLGTLPGGTISRAYRINEAGEIVGEANAADGFFHAVKWTVTPASNAWANLGQGLAGTSGVPQLVGSGSLVPAAPIQWSLSNAKHNAPAWFVVGLNQLALPIFGGVLVPSPDFVFAAATSGAGTATLNPTLSQPLPSGQPISVQAWLLDPAGVAGWAASNAIAATTP